MLPEIVSFAAQLPMLLLMLFGAIAGMVKREKIGGKSATLLVIGCLINLVTHLMSWVWFTFLAVDMYREIGDMSQWQLVNAGVSLVFGIFGFIGIGLIILAVLARRSEQQPNPWTAPTV